VAGSIAKHVTDEQPVALDDASRAADRPGLRRALDYVREGDMLVVWKLDRLGRPLAGRLKSLRGWWSSRPCAGPIHSFRLGSRPRCIRSAWEF
jgi:hypothetical protein